MATTRHRVPTTPRCHGNDLAAAAALRGAAEGAARFAWPVKLVVIESVTVRRTLPGVAGPAPV